MQAIILAAGMGKRLGNLTKDNTKCMVKVNGIPLIDRVLGQLSHFPLSKVILVIGYKGEKLKEYLGLIIRDYLFNISKIPFMTRQTISIHFLWRKRNFKRMIHC